MTRSRNARHMLAALRTADRRVLFGGITLTAMVVLAIIVPLFAPASTGSIGDVIATRLVPPLGRDALGHWHLLGTDAFGRDLFVRLWVGARISLAVAVAGSALSGVIGIALGAVAGWRAGWFDRVISAAGDALLAIPRLVLLLVIAALWGPGLWVVIVVLGLTGWMAVMRLVRAEVQQVRQQSYVEGADALGVPSWRVLARHVLPNAVGSATVAITLGVGNAIVLESGLSFLGLGVQPPTASWGNMIAGGREWLLTAPWIALTPGLLLIATVVACTMLGEGLSESRTTSVRDDDTRTINLSDRGRLRAAP
ncbi:MAG TPA: peptide ABC transporter permease [Gemmatimonas aurantiaca]|uniref:Peptide ABC transporter permease n=1 Tax=Gemmatimonas aurantiaca TaxID=173480 RepID=A0A3D4V8G7_9BACT|nr:peptide ABC transporter permease [Gemmatimonas aurantiaca]